MRVYSNQTTHRLESFARKEYGCDCEIRVIEPHEEGRYFLTMFDGEPLPCAASLGWIDQHAFDSLKRRTWQHQLLETF